MDISIDFIVFIDIDNVSYLFQMLANGSISYSPRGTTMSDLNGRDYPPGGGPRDYYTPAPTSSPRPASLYPQQHMVTAAPPTQLPLPKQYNNPQHAPSSTTTNNSYSGTSAAASFFARWVDFEFVMTSMYHSVTVYFLQIQQISCSLSPLTGFESCSRHVRNCPVTLG